MDDLQDPQFFAYPELDTQTNGPSLPIILISAVVGVGSGVIALYITYQLFFLIAPVSAGLATLALMAGIGLSTGILGRLTDNRAGLLNMAMSCGLVFFSAIFLGFCLLVGVLGATFFLS